MGIFSTAGLFLAVLFCNGIFLQSCLGSGSIPTITCIEQERQALLKFKRSLNDTTRRLSSWTGEDCCNWKGIQCDGNTSHVLKLELGGLESFDLFFEPTIEANEVNPSLLELKYLEHLDLSGNNFHYIPIPIFLGSMTSLRYLYLSNSNFGGRVPHHLGNVSNLMVLDLNCKDTGSLTIDDFTWVSRLSSLQYLDASGMYLSRALNLNVMLNMLPSLTELRLSSCGLHSTLLVSHFYLNSTASNIRKLDLSWNSFAGKFPKFIENLTALRVLDLSVNDLNSSFPPYLENLTALRDLDLSDNNLNSSFPLYLENLKSLEHLNLFHNSFTAVGLLRLLLTQCTLKSLDMSLNHFKGQMSRSYGNLSGCTMYNLERLILRSNSILGNLPDWLGQFKRLKYLDLSENSFSGSIPQSLGTLSALEELRIYANQLNGTIPVSLGQLSSLKRLNIGVNQLTGTIPLSLGQLSNLTSLDLSYNHLDGVLTEANFANLTILEELRIHSNLLTLKVKSDWMPPFQVTSLQMGSCKIGTGFPQWLRTQKKVSSLDISNASISGTLPQWLDEMPLEFLDLSHNLIGGPIQKLPPTLQNLDLSHNLIGGPIPKLPPTLGELDLSDNLIGGLIQKLPPTLEELDLSDNLISGPLPQNISEMVPSLDTLLLAGNLISGLIPYSLWEIPDLRVLDLSRNKLFGNLPRYKGRGALSSLYVMRLSSNKLSGILPSSIGNFTSLQWLHLNNNSFYGELPSTLRNCTSLIVLDLGENRFSGSIPTWIGECLSLHFLRLHKNMFNDNIPSQLCQMLELQIMDFGNNLLTGPIPRCLGNLSGMILDGSGYPRGFIGEVQWFDARMMQVIKGRELEFTSWTFIFLANMDLSGNNLTGKIPKEITNLSGLRGLNLSHNNLTGKIPEKIGGLKSLESLDFSNNQLSGIIPQSISGLNFLSLLNLSYNNLSGRIPTGNQLQTLPSSSYLGNSELCGDPLPRKCRGDENSQPPTATGHREEHEEDDSEKVWFYAAIISGYATGLWGFVGVLLLKKSWRHAYFQFVVMVKEKVLLAIALGVARLKNYIDQFGG